MSSEEPIAWTPWSFSQNLETWASGPPCASTSLSSSSKLACAGSTSFASASKTISEEVELNLEDLLQPPSLLTNLTHRSTTWLSLAYTYVYIPVKAGRVTKRASKTTSKVKRAGSEKDEA
ncbi:hypothetical protein D6D27_10096 [Aureobasidium pullulans]|nr:hypothetical protein D6D27_10096 [Aureobasidium pullulans]